MTYVPDTICPGCETADPVTELIDFGVGQYEYWGFVGYHRDEHRVTRCCESTPVLFSTYKPDEEESN